MKILLKLNIFLFITYAILHSIGQFEGYFIFRFIRFLVGIFTLFGLIGINFSAIFIILLKKELKKTETIAIATISSLLIPPFILWVEYSQFEQIERWFPYANSFIFFLGLLIIFWLKKNQAGEALKSSFGLPKIQDLKNNFLFFEITSLYAIIIFKITTAFYSLPDLDPYYWLSQSSIFFSNPESTPLARPLYQMMIFAISQGAGLDLYATFKFFMPFLFLLVIIPAWLLASKFKSPLEKIVILLIPLVSSSTLLYSLTPMPQSIFIICAYFFFFFLLYSWYSKEKLFFWLAGPIVILAYFFHEISLIFICCWIATVFLSFRKKITEFFIENKLSFFLILALLVSNKHIFSSFIHYFKYWITRCNCWPINTNFRFPAQYVNIDGNAMGWNGLYGIIQYYTYYAGPAIILVLIVGLFWVIRDKKLRQYIKEEIKNNEELWITTSLFLVFFSISEILPRFFSFAFLPERSWIFGGIFSSAFFLIFLSYFKKKKKLLSLLFVLLSSISILGGIYINNLKSYIITNSQLESSAWIKNNLPKERIIFSNRNKQLLSFHSQSKIVLIPDDFMFDFKIYEKEIARLSQAKEDSTDSQKIIETVKKDASFLYDNFYTASNDVRNEIIIRLQSELKNLTSIPRPQPKISDDRSNWFIYYSEEHIRNPYLKRPYYSPESKERPFIFDQLPEKFKRLYSDKKSNIIIWKIL